MKAIKTSIWYEHMMDVMKSTICSAWETISKNNGVNHSPTERKRFENEIDEYFKTLEFQMYELPSIENVISKMADEYFDHKSEKINLWVDICKKTANDPQLPWQMIIERADNVLAQYEIRFSNAKTGNDEQSI